MRSFYTVFFVICLTNVLYGQIISLDWRISRKSHIGLDFILPIQSVQQKQITVVQQTTVTKHETSYVYNPETNDQVIERHIIAYPTTVITTPIYIYAPDRSYSNIRPIYYPPRPLNYKRPIIQHHPRYPQYQPPRKKHRR